MQSPEGVKIASTDVVKMNKRPQIERGKFAQTSHSLHISEQGW